MSRSLFTITMLMFALVLSPLASAGTLESGSTLTVQSNYQGISGLSLLGVWSTTPNLQDRVYISNDKIPEPYDIRNGVELTFNQPKFEQVFEAYSQTAMYKPQFYSQRFNYGIKLTESSGNSACEAAFNTYRSQTQLNSQLLEGFDPTLVGGRYFLGYCDVMWVTVEQVGYYSPVRSDRLFYSQDIGVGNLGTIHLETSDLKDQLVGSIPGQAYVALLDFGQYKTSALQADNVYAFQTGKSIAGAGPWQPFEDNQKYMNTYQTSYNTLITRTGDYFDRKSITLDQLKSDAQLQVANVRNAADNVVANAGKLPDKWSDRIGAPRLATGNLIIVPPKYDFATARLQIAVKGTAFGLFKPTGVCSINSVAPSVTWLETSQGQIAYSVKNTGTDNSAMRVFATCSGGTQINAVAQDISVATGATSSGKLTLTGRSATLNPSTTFDCTFSCLEKNTGQEATAKFQAILQTKQLCAEGEQTAPKLIGANFVVDVLDSTCHVKASLTCDALTKKFVQEGAAWVCVDKAPTSCTGVGCSPCAAGSVRNELTGVCVKEEGGTFNFTVLVIAGIIGLIGGGAVYAYTGVLSRFSKKYGTLLRVLLALAVFIALLFLVAGVVNGIVSLFSFAT